MRTMETCLAVLLAAGTMVLAADQAEHTLTPVKAPEYFVAPDGKSRNPGTKDAPWDIASALGGKQKVAPGATIWLAAGTYRAPDRSPASKGFAVKQAGAQGKPVTVRPVTGARATIDGGLCIQDGADWLVVRDLEITVCELRSEEERTTKAAGSGAPIDVARPWGGLEILGGKHCKYINLVIHDNAQGCGFWNAAEDSEIYGCLIYGNGWKGPDRGHGHCIYSQNQSSTKTISDCILITWLKGAYSLHAYGSGRAYVDNYVIEGNITYNSGPLLVGGGRPSHHITVRKNALYAANFQIGMARNNEDCHIEDNIALNGSLVINNYIKGEARGNMIVEGAINRNNAEGVTLGNNAILAASQRPKEPLVVLRPNKYDDQRAHLAVYNWAKAASVTMDGASFLKDGDHVRLLDPRDFFGKPLFELVCMDGKIIVPMKNEFAAFVMLKIQ